MSRPSTPISKAQSPRCDDDDGVSRCVRKPVSVADAILLKDFKPRKFNSLTAPVAQTANDVNPGNPLESCRPKE